MSDPLVKALLDAMTPEQKQELVASLLDGAKAAEPEVTIPLQREEVQELGRKKQPAVVVNEDFTVTRNNDIETRKQPVRAKKNQWVDTGEDRDEGFDPELFEKMGKAARSRPKYKKATVDCHVCGKTFKIDPDSIYGEFIRCDRCTGR